MEIGRDGTAEVTQRWGPEVRQAAAAAGEDLERYVAAAVAGRVGRERARAPYLAFNPFDGSMLAGASVAEQAAYLRGVGQAIVRAAVDEATACAERAGEVLGALAAVRMKDGAVAPESLLAWLAGVTGNGGAEAWCRARAQESGAAMVSLAHEVLVRLQAAEPAVKARVVKLLGAVAQRRPARVDALAFGIAPEDAAGRGRHHARWGTALAAGCGPDVRDDAAALLAGAAQRCHEHVAADGQGTEELRAYVAGHGARTLVEQARKAQALPEAVAAVLGQLAQGGDARVEAALDAARSTLGLGPVGPGR